MRSGTKTSLNRSRLGNSYVPSPLTDSTFLGLGIVFFSGGMLTVGSATTGVGSGIGSCDAGAFLSELGSTSVNNSLEVVCLKLFSSVLAFFSKFNVPKTKVLNIRPIFSNTALKEI